MAEVKNLFGGGDYEPAPADNPDVVLEAAKGKLQKVIVIGVDHEGNKYYASDTQLSLYEGLFLVEKFKEVLLTHD